MPLQIFVQNHFTKKQLQNIMQNLTPLNQKKLEISKNFLTQIY